MEFELEAIWFDLIWKGLDLIKGASASAMKELIAAALSDQKV